MDHFDTPQEAIVWARNCAADAKSSFGAYISDGALGSVIEEDRVTGSKIYKIKLTKPIPVDIKGKIRNAVVDLKHAFDQNLFAAAQTIGVSRFNRNYPWAETQVGTLSTIEKWKKDKVEIPDFLKDEILRQKPFATDASEDRLVRKLASLANNKHSIGVRVIAAVENFQAKKIYVEGPVELFGTWSKLRNEIVVAHIPPGTSFSMTGLKSSSGIFFACPGELGEIPAFLLIDMLAERAQASLDGFRAACCRNS